MAWFELDDLAASGPVDNRRQPSNRFHCRGVAALVEPGADAYGKFDKHAGPLQLFGHLRAR